MVTHIHIYRNTLHWLVFKSKKKCKIYWCYYYSNLFIMMMLLDLIDWNDKLFLPLFIMVNWIFFFVHPIPYPPFIDWLFSNPYIHLCWTNKKRMTWQKKTLKEIRVTIIFFSHLTDLVRCQIVSLNKNKTEKKNLIRWILMSGRQ